ncbi:MAG: hypothetical protein IIA44_10385 [Acidobacteria bacterium]|nr:hypothetical protein [Acidobacteriota bacterium]
MGKRFPSTRVAYLGVIVGWSTTAGPTMSLPICSCAYIRSGSLSCQSMGNRPARSTAPSSTSAEAISSPVTAASNETERIPVMPSGTATVIGIARAMP